MGGGRPTAPPPLNPPLSQRCLTAVRIGMGAAAAAKGLTPAAARHSMFQLVLSNRRYAAGRARRSG